MNLVKKLMAAVLAIAVVLTTVGVSKLEVKAAGSVQKTTIQQCSVWSAPDTSEANRVKVIPAGYTVSVYPTVVNSTRGDGKTFYKTTKGCYILCKCFGDNSTQTPVTITIPSTGGSTYQTPYSTSNVGLKAGLYNGSGCNYFYSSYKGASAYVAITFYAAKDFTAAIGTEKNCVVNKGLPILVWGYTADGYYLCGWKQSLISIKYEDGFVKIPMANLTEKAPAQVFDPANMVNSKSKKDPDTDSYVRYTYQISLTPIQYYLDYLKRDGVNAYAISGNKLKTQENYQMDLKYYSRRAPIDDYVYLEYEGKSYEENVLRMEITLDDEHAYDPTREAYTLTVPLNEFTPSQFRDMRNDVYQYAVSKYGSAKIGAVRLGGTQWYSGPYASAYAYQPDLYYHFAIGLN